MILKKVEKREVGGYSTLDLDGPLSADGDGLRSVLLNMELDKVTEERFIRISLGIVSVLLANYVIWRIWRDSWRQAQLSYKPTDK